MPTRRHSSSGMSRAAQHEPSDPPRPAHLFPRSIVDASPPERLTSERICRSRGEHLRARRRARAVIWRRVEVILVVWRGGVPSLNWLRWRTRPRQHPTASRELARRAAPLLSNPRFGRERRGVCVCVKYNPATGTNTQEGPEGTGRGCPRTQ